MSIPLSLYIHLPWCIRKCPYCDFNSHAIHQADIPEAAYIDCLLRDFERQLPALQERDIISIFLGGGTPSLFSAQGIARLLKAIAMLHPIASDCEITLEANPGTVEQQRFKGYREAGVNRISLGVQSFQSEKLRLLGRIHDAEEAHRALEMIKTAGFLRFNVDVMHGLPQQTLDDALFDLQQMMQYQPTHVSWYQLTIEPNTYFHRQTPVLPDEEVLFDIEQQGLLLLEQQGFQRYEVSAYAQAGQTCRHNLNYWLFGDYVGIGAGAHSKLSCQKTQQIKRHWNYRSPHTYMNAKESVVSNTSLLTPEDLVTEFMLNTLRVYQDISLELFEQRTFLSRTVLEPAMAAAVQKGLLSSQHALLVTPLGRRYLNDLCQLF